MEEVAGTYRVAGTRVSLDSVVCAFIAGQSAESIAQSFPVLTLEQVYGTIAFYLGHREEVDRYLQAEERDYEGKRAASRAMDPMFYQKLADVKSKPRPPADAHPLGGGRGFASGRCSLAAPGSGPGCAGVAVQ